jgi:hypothetical protein
MEHLESLDVGDWIALIAVVVAMVAALISAWQAHIARTSAAGQLALAERVYRESNEPYVIVDVQPREPWSFIFVIVIENVGPTVARNVRITVSPELESSEGNEISFELREALARTIPMMPPGRRLEFMFDTNKRWQSELPMIFEFSVDATGPFGPVETSQYTVDLNVLGANIARERPTKTLEDELKKVRQQLKRFGDHYEATNRLAIREDVQRQREELQRRREEMQQRMQSNRTQGGD